MTSDSKRHGNATLFAALNALDGTVIGWGADRHRREEFLKFIRAGDTEVPRGLAVHVILINYATHMHPNVLAWLVKHPRFHQYFTPTSWSWLNLVERRLRELTDRAIRRDVFHSVPDRSPRSRSTWRATTTNPDPSSGPPQQNLSWPKSAETESHSAKTASQ
jgi:DDE superfamily endonuclease